MSAATPARFVSLDALRGFTILAMVFVNDAASVQGLPQWLRHMPPGADGMTFVDVVFPAFLFMVGTAIPLAFRRRREAGQTPGRLLTHVAVRSAALVLIGILIMNGRELDPGASGVPYALWNVGMLAGVTLAWNRDPEAVGVRRRLLEALRIASLVVLALFVALYRSKEGGWLDLSNWGILGAIGWAYLAASTLLVLTRGRAWGLALSLAGLVAWNASTRLGVDPLVWTARHFPPLGNGGHASVVVAGILAAKLLLEGRADAAGRLARLALFTAVLAAAGALLAPRFGIAKIGATPSWCLLSAAITAALLGAFHWAVDLRGLGVLARPFVPAGRNALVTYLLPDVFYAVFGVRWLDAWFGLGYVGLVRAAAFSVAVLGAAALLTRWRIRMQL